MSKPRRTRVRISLSAGRDSDQEKLKSLQQHASFIADFFNIVFELRTTSRPKHIHIEILDYENDNHYPEFIWPKDDPVYRVYVYRGFVSKIFKLNKEERFRWFLNILKEQVSAVCLKFDWPTEYVEKACVTIVEAGFKQIHSIGRLKKNRKGLMAGLVARREVEHLTISAEFVDIKDNKLVTRIELFKLMPSMFFVAQLVRSATWKTPSSLLVKDGSGEFEIEISIEDFKPKLNFKGSERGVSGLLEQIQFISIGNKLPNWLKESEAIT